MLASVLESAKAELEAITSPSKGGVERVAAHQGSAPEPPLRVTAITSPSKAAAAAAAADGGGASQDD